MTADYAAVAAALRELGNRLAACADHPALDGAPAPSLTLSVHPAPDGTAANIHQAWVDAVAAAMSGDTPVDVRRQPYGPDEIYAARVDIGRVHLTVHAVVPARAELAAEAGEPSC